MNLYYTFYSTFGINSKLGAKDTFEIFKMDLTRIESVTFLDTLKDAPATVWYMGRWANSNVQAWFTWENRIGQVYIAAEGGINGKNAAKGLFEGMTNLKEINFNGAFHTEQAETMERMFYGCENLEKLDVSTLDTSNVTNMRDMFRGCKRLEELDVSSFDTSNVTMMATMFSGCTNLEKLDLNTFDTSSLKNIGYMFSGCTNLEEVKLNKWDTSKVDYMEATFMGCDSLKDVDLKGWNVDKVKFYSNFMNRNGLVNGKQWMAFFVG